LLTNGNTKFFNFRWLKTASLNEPAKVAMKQTNQAELLNEQKQTLLVLQDEQVKNSAGQRLGYTKENALYNMQEQKLGYVQQGELFNFQGQKLGTLKHGQIVNPQGQMLLQVKGSDARAEALLGLAFFFFLQ